MPARTSGEGVPPQLADGVFDCHSMRAASQHFKLFAMKHPRRDCEPTLTVGHLSGWPDGRLANILAFWTVWRGTVRASFAVIIRAN